MPLAVRGGQRSLSKKFSMEQRINPSTRSVVLRARELRESTSAFSTGFLSREVAYAQASTSVYNRVLREVNGAKTDIATLDARHIGGLGRQVSGARIVAARLAGLL